MIRAPIGHRTKRTPKQYVLKKLPHAFASKRLKYGYWHVYREKDGGWSVIGVGGTEKDAWQGAAEFLRRYGG